MKTGQSKSVAHLSKLSAEDFHLIAAQTDLAENEGKVYAYAVLVEGFTQSEVAAKFNISKQRVNKTVKVVKDAWQKHAQSIGYVEAKLTLPGQLAQELSELFETLNRSQNSQLRILIEERLLQVVRAAQRGLPK